MNILVIGNDHQLQECKQKFGDHHRYTLELHQQEAEKYFRSSDVVFDFMLEVDPLQINVYASYPSEVVFVNTATISLTELSHLANHSIRCTLLGFCGLPTFINRSVLEVSLLQEDHQQKLQEICRQLHTDFIQVDDRVGMVTPRVVCMIINEAYYTVQEGTASRKDIDLAMKLGTNYPYGPFEWAQRIGVKQVYELLEAVYDDTKDERYKICPSLKKEYLQLSHS